MTEKRFTTVELPKPNKWGIWYDGAYLSTYQVCTLLNEYVDVKKENEQLKSKNRGLQSELQIFKEDATHSNLQINKLADENEQLKKDRFICLDCEHSGYTEIGCLCEYNDHWQDYIYECEDFKEWQRND